MIDELLEVRIDLVASVGVPHELIGWVEDEGELIHLGLIEFAGNWVDVSCKDTDMAGGAAQPLTSVLPSHVLAFHVPLYLYWSQRCWGFLGGGFVVLTKELRLLVNGFLDLWRGWLLLS